MSIVSPGSQSGRQGEGTQSSVPCSRLLPSITPQAAPAFTPRSLLGFAHREIRTGRSARPGSSGLCATDFVLFRLPLLQLSAPTRLVAVPWVPPRDHPLFQDLAGFPQAWEAQSLRITLKVCSYIQPGLYIARCWCMTGQDLLLLSANVRGKPAPLFSRGL